MKMPHIFYVTFETVTDESAESGDYAESGFLDSDATPCECRPAPMTLRDALAVLGPEAGMMEADSWPCRVPRWLTVTEDYADGRQDSRTLHIDGVSDASARRIARLLGVTLSSL